MDAGETRGGHRSLDALVHRGRMEFDIQDSLFDIRYSNLGVYETCPGFFSLHISN